MGPSFRPARCSHNRRAPCKYLSDGAAHRTATIVSGRSARRTICKMQYAMCVERRPRRRLRPGVDTSASPAGRGQPRSRSANGSWCIGVCGAAVRRLGMPSARSVWPGRTSCCAFGICAGLAANETVHAARTAVSIARLDMILVTAFSSIATVMLRRECRARLHVEKDGSARENISLSHHTISWAGARRSIAIS